jgi:hypothetical protein
MEEVLDKKDVAMQIDIHCQWYKSPPMYRLYVNDEMFAERNYIWQAGEFLRENLVISAPPGQYTVRIETPTYAIFKLRNLQCSYGDVQIVDSTRFRI